MLSSQKKRQIAVAKPSFDEQEERLVREVLRSGWVTQGPKVAEFEKKFADRVFAEEAVAVTSGTTALFLSLHALGIGIGDEVIVPSLSFIATANCVVHTGATPVFVDVDPLTLNIDPAAVEAAITPRTRAILPVDQLGMPAEMDRINEIAARHQLKVVEDAACAVGSRYRGRPVGSCADLVCFSFHPRKVLVTGEGGMIVTNDRQLAGRLRLLRHHGMSVSDLERHRGDRVIVETYGELGYNFRLSDIHAAVGIVQLGKLDQMVGRRRELAARYNAALADIDAIVVFDEPSDAQFNYQSYIVRLRDMDRDARDALMNEMQRRGVATRRGLMAIHQEPCYARARISGSLKHTEAATEQTMLLPMHAELSDDDQDFVIDQLAESVETLFSEGHVVAERTVR